VNTLLKCIKKNKFNEDFHGINNSSFRKKYEGNYLLYMGTNNQFTFLDQYEQGIPGIHGWLMNKDGVIYDENITQKMGN